MEKLQKFHKSRKENQELKQLESKLKLLERKEKTTEDHLTWSNKTMFRFWMFGLIVVAL
ncbi:MAG: hypothetical protein GXP45_00190 [bacterium]|nr:hypothetical protein [bacterium]